jgi:hypothetical protein
MAQASRLATSQALTRAAANQTVAQAKFGAMGQIAGAALGKFGESKAGGSGDGYASKFMEALKEQKRAGGG